MPTRPPPAYRRSRSRLAINFRTPVWAALAGALLLAVAGFATAATLEEQDSFCAACHSQPESAFYQRTQAQAVDLASKHSATWVTRCIDCHAGPGFICRNWGMALS